MNATENTTDAIIEKKCVILLNEQLPLGLLTNTASILGITIGQRMPEVVGRDVTDRQGNSHAGVIEFPVPILKSSAEQLSQIRQKLYETQYQDLLVVDFTDLAQGCKTYNEYIGKMAIVTESELQYFGIAICGNKKKVTKLTGNIPLLR